MSRFTCLKCGHKFPGKAKPCPKCGSKSISMGKNEEKR